MILGTNGEPRRPIDGMDTNVASRGVQTVALFEAAPQGTAVYKVQLDSFVELVASQPVVLKLVGPDEQLFRLSNNTVEVRTVAKSKLYIAQYQVRWTAQSVLPDRRVHSDTNSASFISIIPRSLQQIRREDYSLTLPPPSTASYLFIYTAE